MTEYTVRLGDTLYSIARKFGITTEQLRLINPEITDPDSVAVGQVIRIPNINQMQKTISVNGYAFLDIDSRTLLNTLPYLTYLCILSYKVNPNGTLVDIDDTSFIQVSRQAGVAPMMVITNTEEDGSFSAGLAHTILIDGYAQQVLINNVVYIIESKNYYGLHIDFEYLYPSDINAYAQFLHLAADVLHPLGYILSIALRLNVLTEQQERLNESFKYSESGRVVDEYIITTNQLAYDYALAMQKSPIDQVHRALDYAVAVGPSSKILLGLPNCCYDRMLPFIQGTPAQLLTQVQADFLAENTGAAIHYDSNSNTLYFTYMDNMGVEHVVWFDREDSIVSCMKLVSIYNLGGVSFWTIELFSPTDYQILDTMYDIRKVLTKYE